MYHFTFQVLYFDSKILPLTFNNKIWYNTISIIKSGAMIKGKILMSIPKSEYEVEEIFINQLAEQG